MDTINNVDVDSTEQKPKSKVRVIIIAAVVILILAAGTYYGVRIYQAKHKSTTAKSTSTSTETSTTATPTTATSTTATPTAKSVSDIKTQIDATNVGQVKSTLTGLKKSLSMFNR